MFLRHAAVLPRVFAARSALGATGRPIMKGTHRASSSHAAGSSSVARILRSDVQDIVFHFAVEDYLMQHAKLGVPLMYLWRPAPVVTIGRHQNPWKECKLAQMEADNVALVRRRSGGGAIFQDLGCSVFTFISPSGSFNIERNLDIVLGALRRCGINAERSGRNDLTFEGRKISGSAFKHSPDAGVSLHHGTVLVNTDMQALGRYLTPDKRKLEAKGITSVGARVMNLQESFPALSHDTVCDALVAEFRDVHEAHQACVEELNLNSPLASEPALRAFHEELGDRKWRLGRTPEFSHRLETRIDGIAVFDVQMQVVGGKITETTIFSDALFPEVIDEAMQALRHVDYGRGSIRTALEALRPHFQEGEGPQKTLDALTEWLSANVDD